MSAKAEMLQRIPLCASLRRSHFHQNAIGVSSGFSSRGALTDCQNVGRFCMAEKFATE
jgi:hypothetical protein